jgi:hypothetical protein
MEIWHASLNHRGWHAHAFFDFRDPAYLDRLPAGARLDDTACCRRCGQAIYPVCYFHLPYSLLRSTRWKPSMKLIKNRGNDRVLDFLQAILAPGCSLDIASPEFSLFGFAALRELVSKNVTCRLVLPSPEKSDLAINGADADRNARNKLQNRWLAKACSHWLNKSAEVREAPAPLQQTTVVVRHSDTDRVRAVSGMCPLTTASLGLTPANPFSLIQSSDTPEEAAMFGSWFSQLWEGAASDAKQSLLRQLREFIDHREPSLAYHLTLLNLFRSQGAELDEEQIVKTATGIKNTVVWKKLFRFQRDGVIGAIDKLERFGGCIIADSVGLGKTLEALAVIKYYELRNDRVLVLTPKRLRDNWTLYKANDRRNILAGDRLHYDVLNHTDLSREDGLSGDLDLTHINWGTIERQLHDVRRMLARIDEQPIDVEEMDIQDVDVDDPAFESMLVGKKVKVLLQDVDLVRWRQDLVEDRDRLSQLLAAARLVNAARDAKLADLKKLIAGKVKQPLNPGNRKVIVFTAFTDTAVYLFEHLAPWAAKELGLQTGLIPGAASPNRTTVSGMRNDMATILSAFAPRAKERPADLAVEGELDLLIATDCISEGQNLQDCDFLVNYDIHWNPVRIIQRFGRIDRIGSPNTRIQLVNFWPNMELEEYINLEQRVSGRMVLLDISATGAENVIEQQSGNQMNDLEYRRKQLLKLQDAVIDIEDLSSGISIADLTLNDFRIDLARAGKQQHERLEKLPLGTFAVCHSGTGENAVPSGAIFCLRAMGESAKKPFEPGYPLAPHYLVHVGDEGEVLNGFIQAKSILDHLKRLCAGQDVPDGATCERFDQLTCGGEDMARYQKLLAAAIASVVGKKEERAVASLFSPGGTHAQKGEFAGMNDFEVVAYVAVLPEENPASGAA